MQTSSTRQSLPFERIALCGVGLIGGSILKALRASGYCGSITVFDIDRAMAARVCEEGYADLVAASPEYFFRDHDLVILCQPVGVLLDYLRAHRREIAYGDALGIDVASVKEPVLQALQQDGNSAALARFIPCHPIAGKATHGWISADADLLQDKLCILTPDAATPPAALARVEEFWQRLGARTARMSADEHDAIYASLSHLPQLLSYAYLHSLAQQPQARQWLAYRGSGFTGFTRLGSSDPALWADIVVHNAAPLLAEIDRFSASLAELRAALAAGERPRLAGHFSTARDLHAATQHTGGS
jgi:prephenate dehydrogenase